MKEYTIQTIKNKISIKIVGTKIIIKSQQPIKQLSLDPRFIFDLMADNLSVRSKNFGIKRRAKQLNGLSLEDAIK